MGGGGGGAEEEEAGGAAEVKAVLLMIYLQIQALNLLESKSSAKHDFVRYCVLFYWQTNENISHSLFLSLSLSLSFVDMKFPKKFFFESLVVVRFEKNNLKSRSSYFCECFLVEKKII